MIILNCDGISLSFGINTVLKDITFKVEENDKIGIVGVNGAGKSTLLKVIAGILQADSGNIYISKNTRLGYLEQNSGLESSNSLWDEVLSVYKKLMDAEERLKALELRISTEKDDERLSSLMKEYSNLSDQFSRNGGFEYRSKVKGVLRGLGFTEEQFDLKVEILSGGQKTRLALAKLLLDEPDILILDEPTNHLDIEAIEWLEGFLKNFSKAVLIVSHDRYFLDSVTFKTLELEGSNSKLYNGNYTKYVEQKAVDREILQKHYEIQQQEIARMEAFIKQQKQWNRERNIIAAESRQKAIDRMEKIEKPKNLPGKIKIKLKSSITSGNDVLFAEGLSKGYPGKPLFKNISFNLKRGEKAFLLGPNGCGKSTLLKILTGKIQEDAGVVEYGHKVSVGYYDQEQEYLDESKSILEEVLDSNPQLTLTQARNMLASFLFKGEDVLKPISVLSGGEKARVSLVKLILSGSNFLILDEPTNHLDINSREVLEESINEFDGTILAVSHDRYFINKLSTRILELNGDSMIDCRGNYSFFVDYKSKLKSTSQENRDSNNISASKVEYQAVKNEKAKARKLEKQLNDTENAIARTEERLKAIEQEMTREEVLSDHLKLTDLYEEQNSLKQELDRLYELWELLLAEKGE
jgi:ATP-binding cassette subfamily F protein 3